mmetsp:Transcript_57901/g.134912  ORF Transcript_57901/g.134912 Transcript_57901/m.134912 type:complete len:163 (+) Transcript_57901:54-542(+)
MAPPLSVEAPGSDAAATLLAECAGAVTQQRQRLAGLAEKVRQIRDVQSQQPGATASSAMQRAEELRAKRDELTKSEASLRAELARSEADVASLREAVAAREAGTAELRLRLGRALQDLEVLRIKRAPTAATPRLTREEEAERIRATLRNWEVRQPGQDSQFN